MKTEALEFVKMTGAGNDFVLIDDRAGALALDWSTLAPSLCDRRYGIGADGLLILKPAGDADFLMEYYNADGSHGGMCGNGGRCAAHYVMGQNVRQDVSFSAVHHRYTAKRLADNSICLRMKDITTVTIGTPIDVLGHRINANYVDSGTAHVVLWHDDLPEALRTQLETDGIGPLGSAIRNDRQYGAGGTNVNVVRQLDASSISMRTYERGVEGETLACGTGAVASAIIAHIVKKLPQVIRVITRGHEELTVSFTSQDKSFTFVELTGPAKIAFRGSLSLSDLQVRL